MPFVPYVRVCALYVRTLCVHMSFVGAHGLCACVLCVRFYKNTCVFVYQSPKVFRLRHEAVSDDFQVVTPDDIL